MLDQDAIAEFTEIYKSEFGIELSQTEASEKATVFLNLLKILATDSITSNSMVVDESEEIQQYDD